MSIGISLLTYILHRRLLVVQWLLISLERRSPGHAINTNGTGTCDPLIDSLPAWSVHGASGRVNHTRTSRLRRATPKPTRPREPERARDHTPRRPSRASAASCTDDRSGTSRDDTASTR